MIFMHQASFLDSKSRFYSLSTFKKEIEYKIEKHFSFEFYGLFVNIPVDFKTFEAVGDLIEALLNEVGADDA